MSDAIFEVPAPQNEPVTPYAPGSEARARLDRALDALIPQGALPEIPVVINGERVLTDQHTLLRAPHDHALKLARVHHASAADVQRAIDGALAAQKRWAALPFEARAAVFLRAAAKLAGPWRERINAACMLGQSKTCHQAEIDAACELIDFFRFNVHFAREIHKVQPRSSAAEWNRAEYRPLEGFVLAITPFNFLSIAVNLAAAPALLGNVVLWKPSHTSMLGAYLMLQLLEEAGLPPGVIQLIGGDGPVQGEAALESPHLAAIHFTGSTQTFRALSRGVAERLDRYRSIPRVVGETGGKDFILAHPSADVPSLVTAILRGGFEYQGQKCSAASRVYLPRSLYPQIREGLQRELAKVIVGDVRDPKTFMGAVIDERAFSRLQQYQALARESVSEGAAELLFGGGADASVGYFVEPTLVRVDDPKHRLMCEEIFGPLVTIYVYEDAAFEETLTLVDETSPYALTGAIFARDRYAIEQSAAALRHSAGNFYINDKPTGAVVGQQPFGGARASGTNDKAGAMWNLLRWVSPRSIKENLNPPTDWRYPFLAEPK